MRCFRPLLVTACNILGGYTLPAAIVTSPTTDWNAIFYPGSVPDPPSDNQANLADLELIGDLNNPAFYIQFNAAGDASATDGTLAFRMRVSGNQGQPSFAGNAWVGLDINQDAALDLFLGADKDSIGIYGLSSGTGATPKDTKISQTPLWSTPTDSSNYSWTPVTFELDPTAESLDLDSTAGPDYFISYLLPFAEIVTAVNNTGKVDPFDDTSTLNYIAATASQGQTLNSDINGVNGGNSSSSLFSDLDAISEDSGVDGTPIPEPQTQVLLTAGMVALLVIIRRSCRKA